MEWTLGGKGDMTYTPGWCDLEKKTQVKFKQSPGQDEIVQGFYKLCKPCPVLFQAISLRKWKTQTVRLNHRVKCNIFFISSVIWEKVVRTSLKLRLFYTFIHLYLHTFTFLLFYTFVFSRIYTLDFYFKFCVLNWMKILVWLRWEAEPKIAARQANTLHYSWQILLRKRSQKYICAFR